MKHFKFRKKEYVILEKDLLEDALYTAVTAMNAHNVNYYVNHKTDFDIENLIVEDQIFWVKHCVIAQQIVDKILENL